MTDQTCDDFVTITAFGPEAAECAEKARAMARATGSESATHSVGSELAPTSSATVSRVPQPDEAEDEAEAVEVPDWLAVSRRKAADMLSLHLETLPGAATADESWYQSMVELLAAAYREGVLDGMTRVQQIMAELQ